MASQSWSVVTCHLASQRISGEILACPCTLILFDPLLGVLGLWVEGWFPAVICHLTVLWQVERAKAENLTLQAMRLVTTHVWRADLEV